MNACTRVVVPNRRIRMLMDHSVTKSRVESTNRFISISLSLLDGIAVDQHECAAPAGLGEKILRQVADVIDIYSRRVEIAGRRVVGPVDHQRLADDVFSRDESPVEAVERGIAIIPHRKKRVGRDYDFAIDDVML